MTLQNLEPHVVIDIVPGEHSGSATQVPACSTLALNHSGHGDLCFQSNTKYYPGQCQRPPWASYYHQFPFDLKPPKMQKSTTIISIITNFSYLPSTQNDLVPKHRWGESLACAEPDREFFYRANLLLPAAPWTGFWAGPHDETLDNSTKSIVRNQWDRKLWWFQVPRCSLHDFFGQSYNWEDDSTVRYRGVLN